MEKAQAVLDADSRVVAVCGRRRERFPDASVYNRLFDLEWDAPTGEVPYCGGDVMMRVDALAKAGGFNPAMIAGEEPELCVRLRKAGGTIVRIPEEMTLHDADTHRFGQWWRRSIRGGHAYAEGAALHGGPPMYHHARQVRSTLFWGLLGPLAFVAAMLVGALITPWGFAVAGLTLVAYLLLALRIYRWRRQLDEKRHAALFAAFCVIGKFPQALGVLRYWWNRVRGRRAGLIEYKDAPSA